MMYYRRKILLALVEAFGGTLKRMDFQKLLFLFCQHTGRNFYDFFPYKYGGFSFLSYQDKNLLTVQGYLKTSDDFARATKESFVDQLKAADRAALQSFALGMAGLLGRALVRKAYLAHPQYACRSTILSDVLSQEEIASLQPWWQAPASPCLFTIGYEGKSIDAYLHALIASNVGALVDVRKNAFSMKYGFSKSQLQNYVERAGLAYYHLADLGIPSALRQALTSPQAYHVLFEQYRTEILPEQTDSLREVKALLLKHGRIALTCFEKDHLCCHRHEVAVYLQEKEHLDTAVVHL